MRCGRLDLEMCFVLFFFKCAPLFLGYLPALSHRCKLLLSSTPQLLRSAFCMCVYAPVRLYETQYMNLLARLMERNTGVQLRGVKLNYNNEAPLSCASAVRCMERTVQYCICE